jgi:hypothetical protein
MLVAQTRVEAPKNPYPPAKDYELGQQAAAQVEQKVRVIRDPAIEGYIQNLGQRLAESIPPQFQHPEFRYSYKVVEAADINAFALPGGFTYVHTGLIAAASNEGELAGVIAHEISHVALRHGTAQVAKQQKYQGLSLGGQVLGAILGGGAGAAVSQASQIGVGSVLLRFSRDYEKQADILGAQIMANAGYDPRDLANMFQTIEKQAGGKSGPQWMSDHPNPGNRTAYINQEAQSLQIKNPVRDTQEFQQAKARLTGGGGRRNRRDVYAQGEPGSDGRYDPRNPNADPRSGGGYPGTGTPGGRVAPPSTRLRSFNASNDFRLSIPDNWQEVGGGGAMTFAPQGGYGQVQGQPVFTHGALVGVAQTQSRNLRQATDAFLNQLLQGNRNVKKAGNYETEDIAGRQGLSLLLSNISEATGQPETVVICTAFLRNGSLFYFIGVAPQSEYRSYQQTFQRIVQSIELN